MADIKNPLKAIRAKCLDCSGDYINEVRECPVTDCALYPFRMGKNPFRKPRQLSEEAKQKLMEANRKYRAEKIEIR